MKYFKLEHIEDKFKIAGMYDSPSVDNSTGVIVVNETELAMIKPELIINLDKYIRNKWLGHYSFKTQVHGFVDTDFKY